MSAPGSEPALSHFGAFDIAGFCSRNGQPGAPGAPRPYGGLQGPWVWGDWDNFEGLVHHVLRSDYGTLSLRAGDMGVYWWSHPLK